MKHVSHSLEETTNIAQEFAKELNGGEFVALIGDLGSGKTTFTRALANALGTTARVKSPTFTLINEYSAQHKSIKRIFHIDLYRIQEAAEDLHIEELLTDDSIIVAEWPESVLGDFGRVIEVRFSYGENDNERVIEIGESK